MLLLFQTTYGAVRGERSVWILNLALDLAHPRPLKAAVPNGIATIWAFWNNRTIWRLSGEPQVGHLRLPGLVHSPGGCQRLVHRYGVYHSWDGQSRRRDQTRSRPPRTDHQQIHHRFRLLRAHRYLITSPLINCLRQNMKNCWNYSDEKIDILSLGAKVTPNMVFSSRFCRFFHPPRELLLQKNYFRQ